MLVLSLSAFVATSTSKIQLQLAEIRNLFKNNYVEMYHECYE
jgi:hypothetical protein